MSTSRSFPGFDNLYSLHSSGSDREFRADIDFHGADPLEVTRGEHRLAAPASAKWAMGSSVPGHLIWTRYVRPFLVSDELVGALRQAEITGWDTYPVKLNGKDGKRIQGYQGFIVRGRSGPIDFSRSVRLVKERPAMPFLKGIAFEEQSWDGSDVFMPAPGEDGEGAGFIFLTEPAKSTLSKLAKKARFERLDEIEIPMP